MTAPILDDPSASALLFDVDGTLAPIVDDPEGASVPAETVDLLATLAERYRLVACISGRRALDARRIVGLGQLVYAGNHGLELLRPGDEQPRLDPRLGDVTESAAAFAARLDPDDLASAGLRLEDKGPIQAIHWRGAADAELAERRAEAIAVEAAEAGLDTHHGRLVLELRPPIEFGKGVAVRELIATSEATAALYAGDDRTDLDAFAELRELAAEGVLSRTVCVGVASSEGPAEIQREADIVVGSPSELLDLLRGL